MQLYTHLAIAFLLGLLVYFYFPNEMFFGVLLLSALLPDIDMQQPFRSLLSHRGFLHSFIFLVIASAFLSLFSFQFAAAFFLGYVSHLASDALTPHGIYPFWPSSKRISGPIKVGSILEKILFFLICALIIAFFVSMIR